MISRSLFTFACVASLLFVSSVTLRAEDKPASSAPAQTSGAAGGNPTGGAPPACRPIPAEAAGLKVLAQHVPSLGVTLETTIIPNAQPITLHLAFPEKPKAPPSDFGVVGTAGSSAEVFPIVSWTPFPTDSKKGDLVVGPIPGVLLSGVGWSRINLLVVGCADGNVLSGTTDALVSLRAPSAVLAAAFTALLYVVGALTISVPPPSRRSRLTRLSPLWLALDGSGRASLSNLQIIFFSVIVLYLVSYILLRTGILASLSDTVLLLLGIAAVGSVGGKLATANTQRLSFDNLAWTKRKGWTNTDGYHVSTPKWSDFFTTNDDFDPYKFQMLSFSLVIGVALLMTGLSGLANFSIPTALLGVIGLSQATYLGGKIAAPATFGDLDNKLAELRKAQDDFLAATADKWVPPTKPGTPERAAQLAAAEADNRAKYCKFQALVGPAYTMFSELFVDRGANPSLEPEP
jgi:hypothetical protein